MSSKSIKSGLLYFPSSMFSLCTSELVLPDSVETAGFDSSALHFRHTKTHLLL
ncbi:hypothetical protein CsatA_000966 [Cannabis sativa]